MAPHLLGAIAVAAYSYMSLVPLIQPPIMTLCTSKADRAIKMDQLRTVTKFERIIFPIFSTIFISLLLPPVCALIGMLMLGNLYKEAGCLDRLSDTAQNALMNIVTIFGSFRSWYYAGLYFWSVHEDCLRRQGKSADRFGRRIRRSDGCPCIPGCRSEG